MSTTSLMLITVALLLAGFFLAASRLTAGRDFSSHRDEISVLTAQVAETDSYSTNKDLVVFGILTNRGSVKWQVGDFEVRLLDKNGKLGDVASVGEYFTLLPHSEHAFRLTLYRRRLDPLYPFAKVYVRSAKDSKNQ